MTMNTFMTSLRDQVARIRSDYFLLAWNISVFVAFFLPLIIFGVARAGMSQGDENRNQNQHNQNQDDNFHSWWQFWKSNNNNEDQHGNAGQDGEDGAPWWCKFVIISIKLSGVLCLTFFSYRFLG